jgi:general secretion pathway protein C
MKSRTPLETASIYLLMAFIGFIIADLSILYFRPMMLPVQPPPTRVQPPRIVARADRSAYNGISDRNIYNSDQKIADPVGSEGGEGKAAPDAAPVPSTLPIQLLGTIVHANPERSIATITARASTEPLAVKVNGKIPDLATVVKIERSKIIFRNNASQRLEYIEMKDDSKITFGSAAPVQQGDVTKVSDTQFELKQDDINRLTNNLPELLQQARAVPRMGPNGQIECFSLADIAQGSIYEQLGLRKGDCIKSVNGEKIDSPGKAMEMYNALRSGANSINIGIERGGQDQENSYSITK